MQAMKVFMDRLVWVVSAFALIALLIGCGSPQKAVQEAALEKAIEANAAAHGQNIDVDIDNQSTTITTDAGTMQVTPDGSGTIPKSFPSDVPTYSGAQVRSAMENTNDHMHMVQLFTTDAFEKVTEHFKTAVPPKGWTEDTTVDQGGSQPMSILGYKKDDRNLTYMITKESDGTAIMITVAAQ